MTTIADALQSASDRMDAATQLMSAIRDQVAAQLVTQTTATQTIVNNFINRPPVQAVYVDPVNGNDANDGSTLALALKTVDAALSGVAGNSVEIRLLGDVTIRNRYYIYAPLTFTGIQRSANSSGYAFARRTISFIGTADNSPNILTGTYSSGLFIYGSAIRTIACDFALPDVPAGLNYRAHFTVLVQTAFSLDAPTLSVSTQQAAALISTANGRATLIASVIFGSGATGHLFDGVGAGANPNNLFQYSTNITSA